MPSRHCLHDGWRIVLVNMRELCSRKMGVGGLNFVRLLRGRHLSTKHG